MCMSVLPDVYLCLVPVGAQKQGLRFPGTEVMDGCDPLCGCWELNLDLLKGQVLLNAEPSLRSCV